MPKTPNKLTEAILETAEGMHRIGVMDDKTYRNIIVRLLGKAFLANAKPINGKQIRAMRKRTNLSQAAFARYFNRTPSYISQWERGTKQPKGPALVLLNVIKRKGFEAIL
jgi:putative transcriptional regulator